MPVYWLIPDTHPSPFNLNTRCCFTLNCPSSDSWAPQPVPSLINTGVMITVSRGTFALSALNNDTILHWYTLNITDIQRILVNQAKNPVTYHLIHHWGCLGGLLKVLAGSALSTFSRVNLMLPSKYTQPRWDRKKFIPLRLLGWRLWQMPLMVRKHKPVPSGATALPSLCSTPRILPLWCSEPPRSRSKGPPCSLAQLAAGRCN